MIVLHYGVGIQLLLHNCLYLAFDIRIAPRLAVYEITFSSSIPALPKATSFLLGKTP